MTPKNFAAKAKKIIKEHRGDAEVRHSKLDELMEETLEALGFKEGVAVIRATTRWYA